MFTLRRIPFYSDAENPFRIKGEEVVASPAAGKYARAGRRSDFVHYMRRNRTKRGIGTYPSLAMKVSFPYFSSLELALLQYLDTLIAAVFWVQPVRFKIVVEEQLGRYTPDFGVLFEGRRIMIETKFEDDANTKKNLARWPAIRAELAACGYEFLLVDEKFLQEPIFASRLEALQRFRRFPFDELDSFRLQSQLSAKACWRLDEVLDEISKLGMHEDMFFASVLRRQIHVDLTAPIDEATEVFPARTAPFPTLFRA